MLMTSAIILSWKLSAFFIAKMYKCIFYAGLREANIYRKLGGRYVNKLSDYFFTGFINGQYF